MIRYRVRSAIINAINRRRPGWGRLYNCSIQYLQQVFTVFIYREDERAREREREREREKEKHYRRNNIEDKATPRWAKKTERKRKTCITVVYCTSCLYTVCTNCCTKCIRHPQCGCLSQRVCVSVDIVCVVRGRLIFYRFRSLFSPVIWYLGTSCPGGWHHREDYRSGHRRWGCCRCVAWIGASSACPALLHHYTVHTHTRGPSLGPHNDDNGDAEGGGGDRDPGDAGEMAGGWGSLDFPSDFASGFATHRSSARYNPPDSDALKERFPEILHPSLDDSVLQIRWTTLRRLWTLNQNRMKQRRSQCSGDFPETPAAAAAVASWITHGC